ncbi:MAG TPA: helix-turn-helix transcriptional regulator [Nocardia sp.]|uniref:helix-turn-helix domain-containing protein n=1 Tax=Nocardia TaxID=1817 RepID=UPI002B4B4FEF|nr:helix-turn-helix transcriptional regulator [Nocardia sp.]HLS77168.1 helix-turn-helix transcriptional regulator [Nocardia sp.]
MNTPEREHLSWHEHPSGIARTPSSQVRRDAPSGPPELEKRSWTVTPSSTRALLDSAPSTDASSTLARRQLGRYLRDWRNQAGLTIADAARLMEWGATTLQRVEKGQADRLRSVDIQELCRIYGIPEEISRALAGLAKQRPGTSWWHAFGELIPASFDVYAGVEATARELFIYQPELVPALVQIPDYARALLRHLGPEVAEDDIERRAHARMARQAALTRRSAPVVAEVVVHEAALRRVVGGPKVMAAQLRHLADLGTRSNVGLRVLPFSAGVPLGEPTGPFTVLCFGGDARARRADPPVVHVSGYTGDLYLERSVDVHRYLAAHECLRRSALDAQTSRRLLREVAKDYAAAV